MDTRSNYDLIYAAAERLDVGELVKLYQRRVPIDSLDQHGLFTPAASLASSRNDEAVRLLQAFGADISSIAMGYAAGNNILQTRTIVRNHCVNLNKLAIGAGMTFSPDLRAELITAFDLAPEWVVFGAVMSEQTDYALELLQYLKSEYDQKKEANYAAAFQSAYLTYLYASKLTRSKAEQLPLANQTADFPELHRHVLWIKRLEIRDMYAGDKELQKVINGLYGKKNNTKIPSNKRVIELQAQKNLLELTQWLPACDMHYHTLALTYELTFADNSDFVLAMQHANKDLSECCNMATQYRALMQEYRFDYHQAMLYATNELVRTILAQAVMNEGEKYNESLRQLSHLPEVDDEIEAQDMLQKFYLAKIKEALIKLLDEFCMGKDNLLTSLLTNPKLSRLTSLKIGIAYIESLKDLHELICFESALFNNLFVPQANPLLPYHLQPLANKNTDESLVKLFSDLKSSRLFKSALTQPGECGYMITYRDITAPNPIDPVNESAVKNARQHFVDVMSKYTADNQTSVWNLSLFGNKTHKITRVCDMQEAATRAATRQDLIQIALHQFGLYTNLSKPKPHPQAPKHLTLMTDEETSPQFRQMVEALLTCDQVKPVNFK